MAKRKLIDCFNKKALPLFGVLANNYKHNEQKTMLCRPAHIPDYQMVCSPEDEQ